ncbi:hypothetical protein DMA11_11780 [Marinilabiliaceae bacterium JC017]|nr:hypothetical protein DMA11_11780 [Marinilabiliaceae bacterium JC017]
MVKHIIPEITMKLSHNLSISVMIDKTEDELDIQTLLAGPICMYHNELILDKDLEWYHSNRYQVIDMDTANWSIDSTIKSIYECLEIYYDYADNLDAFNDILDDMRNRKYKGLLLVFRHFDNLYDKDREFCENMLDIISNLSRRWMVTNNFLITNIQTNDPDFFLPKLGGVIPAWNGQEWLNSNRK